MITTETIVTEIKNLIPQEMFKKGFHQDYDMIIDVFADDVLKKLPKDHTIEKVDEQIFIMKKEPELEGYDKFVHDAQSINAGDDRISFAEYLEVFINATGRNQFLK